MRKIAEPFSTTTIADGEDRRRQLDGFVHGCKVLGTAGDRYEGGTSSRRVGRGVTPSRTLAAYSATKAAGPDLSESLVSDFVQGIGSRRSAPASSTPRSPGRLGTWHLRTRAKQRSSAARISQ